MKVVRFVSEAELNVFLAGGRLMNGTVHAIKGYNTTSVGFCFAEITPERDADKWLRKLFFITKAEYCIVFETDDFTESLTESKSVYSDDYTYEKTITVREWCSTTYSRHTHPYLAIGKCPDLDSLVRGAIIKFNVKP